MTEGAKFTHDDIYKMITFQGPHLDLEMSFWRAVEKLSCEQLYDLLEYWSASFARPKSL